MTENSCSSKCIKINDKVCITDLEKTDLHMHTLYCDGQNSPEEMVLSALEKGFSCMGFSGHSYVSFDEACGMPETVAEDYRAAITSLKEKYRDRIQIFCGIEQDYFSETATDLYDYVIGSVHYLQVPGGYVSVDDTPEILTAGVREYFGNDYYLMAEKYYETVSDVVNKTSADIIGHFDLVSKFNEKFRMFDEHHPRYVSAWKKAAECLLQTGKVFEINTGAVYRGWKSSAYPSAEMISYIRERGGRLILSGDSHDTEGIGYRFGEYLPLCGS